ncbi:hypothetical protein GLOIN_2v1668798 [Rhizophagus irregularis DAOM 181602=DAOM 197198]|uniref:Uncharacterized protein n=1 Tax=Rhizophagus irregularis (strain DAOM 181602 / DAOM 197198 / MUCL 43194) TaxID=747089 RepID=A0A2P4PIM0_RHIID|nr:hypothetical protein GLOIN_2v1668798 [Rhizophagus irregularis DAOM 181602=DAOM 197198]POG65241.1 hypothetical protein GLOIN_2v1668798 [Rhizophagus irregularis DAOM 181602=DAOM 197198]GET52884.1 hypothetical protein GLOIN_2v1668798 [Rhizophagus irregularis DAOM 181602=DAOM 197198]|eukprot:XP_025172107.1 hypothetical protein GLOIN_2v1668798 [Rhizophagus irregularis DAOM 181602=DAOM 197198]
MPADKELKLLIYFCFLQIDVSIIILLPLFSFLYFLPAIPLLLFFSSSLTKYASNLTKDFTYHKLIALLSSFSSLQPSFFFFLCAVTTLFRLYHSSFYFI